MINDETKKELDAIPDAVFLNWLRDVMSDEPGVFASTFMLAMQFRTITTMDLWEYLIPRFTARLSGIVANRNQD